MKTANTKIPKKTILFIILIVFFVAADRFLKLLCLRGYFDQPFPIIGDVFSLNFAKNYYISFSIPLSGPIMTGIIGLIILILLFFWLKKYVSCTMYHTSCVDAYPLLMLITGAILNFADRLRYGYVIDYLSLKYFTVFNLADCLICFGVVWLLHLSFKKNRSAVD